MKNIDLLIIDPQNDFCDPKGSLYVNKAEKDMERISKLIDNIGDNINRIFVTLDTHYFYDISHNVSYQNKKGENPPPFTILNKEQIVNEEWFFIGRGSKLFNDLFNKTLITYLEKLDENKRYPLCLWPPHCVVGTYGNSIYPILSDSLEKWMLKSKKNVNYITKGMNVFTEHYSAIKAEVPDPLDKSTHFNRDLVFELEVADTLLIGGEAGSHCVKSTVEDIVDGFTLPEYIEKVVLLEDGMSPVSGFEDLQKRFMEDMIKKGMKIKKTTDLIII